jgi:hypothetical protein
MCARKCSQPIDIVFSSTILLRQFLCVKFHPFQEIFFSFIMSNERYFLFNLQRNLQCQKYNQVIAFLAQRITINLGFYLNYIRN